MAELNGKSMTAHRAAWIQAYGAIAKGLVVCHRCDNGLCVKLDHLFLGTMKENMRDCIEKGRFHKLSFPGGQKGQLNNNAKPFLVERNMAIIADRKAGLTFSQLRKKHGIKSNGHLKNILDMTWV